MSEAKQFRIQVKRIYDPPAPEDGVRILIDRLWPRGISKAQAAVDHWMKEIAPSPELRKSFCHQPELFEEFRERYMRELEEDPLHQELAGQICSMAAEQPVTLLYAAKDPVYNHANVLEQWLNRQLERQNAQRA